MSVYPPSAEYMPGVADGRQYYGDRCEVLACRLILAHLLDDPADREAASWCIKDDTGQPFAYFEMANRSAQVAANFWRKSGQVESARTALTERLRQLQR